jgi:transposase
MRSQGTAQELEARRRLAVARVLAGYKQRQGRCLFGSERRRGQPLDAGLPQSGWHGWHPGQADAGQAAQAQRPARKNGSWLGGQESPTTFGFATDLWTSRRLATLIEQRWGIRFNANYLVKWLTDRKHSPQKPTQPARERDEAAIARWRAEDWPRLQKKPGRKKLTSS